MNAPGAAAPSAWALIGGLAAKARAAESMAALRFVIVNDTFALLPYRSALLLESGGGGLRLSCASGLTTVDRRSAYGSWVEQATGELLRVLGERTRAKIEDLPHALRDGWREYWPQTVHVHRLVGHDGTLIAVVVYITEVEWPALADAMLALLHQVQGAAFDGLRQRSARWRSLLRGADGRRTRGARIAALALVAAVAAMFVPVRQFVIAPAEVISLESIAVTSPVEGIIGAVVVRPSEPVRKGMVLAKLDDTALRNRLESALQALEVARAEYLAGAHRSMMAGERAAEAGVLRGRIQERLAEVAFLREQLALLDLRAPRDGIAVFGHVNDLVGKPVGPGQKVMELADPGRIGVQVWVPVADAINLAEGARFSLMLYADPLTARGATLEQSSYQAVKSPDGVASYRVRATLDAPDASRLGLRGNAKIDGEQVALGYFLFRRPIIVVRQWLGV